MARRRSDGWPDDAYGWGSRWGGGNDGVRVLDRGLALHTLALSVVVNFLIVLVLMSLRRRRLVIE